MFGISFINITYPDNPMRCCYRVESLCSNIEVGCSLWGAFSVTLLVVEQLLLLCAKWSSLNTWSEQTVFCVKAHTEVWGRSPHNNQEEIHLNIDPLWFTSTLYVMHPPDKWMKCGVLKTNKETGRRKKNSSFNLVFINVSNVRWFKLINAFSSVGLFVSRISTKLGGRMRNGPKKNPFSLI